MSESAARKEAAAFLAQYSADVQFVFSRAHHHHHRWDEKTKRWMPLLACLRQGTKDKCKAGFPKNLQISEVAKVVCRGVAAKHGLRISGRRNALGSILGKRNCPWFSGTLPAFAALFRSNTNTSPNFRVPITAKTHEASCGRDCLDREDSDKKLWLVAQKAGKQTTGYFAGYTVKRQPVGKYEMAQSTLSLNSLQAQIQDDKPLRQVARVTNRILSDLEVKGKLSPAPEEFNLAMHMEPHDVMAAEFIRTYDSVDFSGRDLLQRLEREQKQASRGAAATMMRLPTVKVTAMAHVGAPPWVELYGFRSAHGKFLLLSPFEFHMWWRPVRLWPPCHPDCAGRTSGPTRASRSTRPTRTSSRQWPWNRACTTRSGRSASSPGTSTTCTRTRRPCTGSGTSGS